MDKDSMLENLFTLYLNRLEKDKYIFEDTEIIEYDEKDFDGQIINIELIKTHDVYMIFVLCDKEQHLGFKVLFEESENNLINEYYALKNDMIHLSLEDFLGKYFDKLKRNFLL